jgi:hypothetical protein
MKRSFLCICLGTILLLPLLTTAQTTPGSTTSTISGQNGNVINTAVPFLNFTPDARSGALGEAGVAASPDANAVYWNSSKLVFADQDAGLAASYTPWLRQFIDDMYYAYLTGYKKLDKNQAIGVSLMYFDLGTINFTNNLGISTGTFKSQEYAVTASYARKLSQNFSMGVNLRYLNSNLAGNTNSLRPGSTVAADITAYYQNQVRDDATGKGLGWAFGGTISNIGGKINYGSAQQYQIPTNLKLGGNLSYYSDQYNRFNFLLDFNKLMVPSSGAGASANQSVFSAMFSSFGDAPDGFGGELKEITISTGVEYWYNDLFAARLGYFSESQDRGDRKYITAGLGLKLRNQYGLDVSYLQPLKGGSPLASTFRVTLLIDLQKGSRIDDNVDTEE